MFLINRNGINIYLKYVILFLILNFTPSIAAKEPHVINISHDEYNANNKNWSIGQDERGIIYIANDSGLLEFDGITWRLNRLPNSVNVRSIAVLSHNTIFTGSYEEFGRWDRDLSGRLKYTSLSKGVIEKNFKNDDFWKICVSGNKIYYQSFASVYIYDLTNSAVTRLNGNIAFLFLFKIRNELLAQQIKGALYRIKNENVEKIAGSDIFTETEVRTILPYENDNYLIGTSSKGIFIYDGVTLKNWNPALSAIISSKELNCGIQTSDGKYYFGTILGGIYITDTDGNIINQLSTDNILQNNTVLSVYEDSMNNVWAGLDRGISYIQYFDNLSFHINTSSKSGTVYDAVLWNNKLFIGTNQGVYYIPENNIRAIDNISDMKFINRTQGQVWALRVIDGKLYCCHNRGLKEISTDLSVSDKYNFNTGIFDITEARIKERDLLLVSSYNTLKVIDKKKGLLEIEGQVSEPISKTLVDHLGNIWLQHAKRGVYRYRLNEEMNNLRSISYYGGINNDSLPYQLKIFKVGGRIALLGEDSFYIYDDIKDRIIPDEILNNCFKGIKNIKQVIHIKDHKFWAITNTSIYKFSYDGYDASILESYDIGQTLFLVNSHENISVINDSISIICLDHGFTIYSNEKHTLKGRIKKLPAPYIESLRIKNQAGHNKFMDINTACAIENGFNTITIGFTGKDAFPLNYSFRYKLENVDPDWSTAQKIDSITYERLPQGDYKFLIQSADHLGHISDVTSLSFTILPPWFKMWWAYIIYIIAATVVIFAVWKIVKRRYRNINLQKIRAHKVKRLEILTKRQKREIEEKNAELLTQTSFIIQKNELIVKLREAVQDFYKRNENKSLIPLKQKINILLNDVDTEEDWKMFLIKFDQKHTDFFKKLKNKYPQLTSNDLRLCACIKLNLDIKETASLMNLSTRAIENNRYRLRKKLNLHSSDNLYDFFINID